jgi:ABC-type lipoprotein export system ATPase subunit
MLLVKNLKKSFVEPGGGVLPILDVEEFQLAAGEQAVLSGRSGCGKTTLLHVIAGISTPDSGEVRVDGRDSTRLGEADRDRFRAETIGYVFQSFNLLPGFTALENVLLGMAFGHGRRDVRRAKELLKRVGLGHRQGHKPSAL